MSFWTSDVIEEAEKSIGFDPLPAGNYRVMLIDSEVKETKAGGFYLNAKFELNGNPQFDGRVLFHKFNVVNANATAVSIGLGQIKDFSTAVGKLNWYEELKTVDSWEAGQAKLNNMFNDLGNIAVDVKVSLKHDEKYGDQNDIKRFKPVSSGDVAVVSSKKTSSNPWE